MFNCPLSPQKADQLAGVLELRAGARVIDVGCGTGEFLVRLIEQYDVHGTGIDPAVDSLEQCRQSSEKRIRSDRLALHLLKVEAFELPDQPSDAAEGIGS